MQAKIINRIIILSLFVCSSSCLNFPYNAWQDTHFPLAPFICLPSSSVFLSLLYSPPNDVWLRCGLIAGLTDGVEERCAVNMRWKRGLVTVCGWKKKKSVHKFLLNCCRFPCAMCLCVAEPERVKEGLVCLCATPHALIKQHQLGMNEHQ